MKNYHPSPSDAYAVGAAHTIGKPLEEVTAEDRHRFKEAYHGVFVLLFELNILNLLDLLGEHREQLADPIAAIIHREEIARRERELADAQSREVHAKADHLEAQAARIAKADQVLAFNPLLSKEWIESKRGR